MREQFLSFTGLCVVFTALYGLWTATPNGMGG